MPRQLDTYSFRYVDTDIPSGTSISDWRPQRARRRRVASDASLALAVIGYTSTGEPVVAAEELRAWLRRPDPRADET